MNNLQVIEKFLNRQEAKTNLRDIQHGYYSYKGRTLTSDGTTLINYETPIAHFDNHNTLWLNTDKYSVTTSKIQSQLKRQAYHTLYIIFETNEEEIKEIIKRKEVK